MKKLLSLVLAVVMVLGLVACGGNAPETTAPAAPVETTPAAPETTEPAAQNIAELKSLANKEYGVDYVSLYSKFGKDVTIDQVI